jgi:hypothetical protein
MRLLVITNETAEGKVLHDAIVRLAPGPLDRVVVVAPALNSRLRYWLSDADDARAAAEDRLQSCVARLRAAGVAATGWIGDADPVQAIADAIALGSVDEVLISTHPEGASHWLARDLVSRALRFGLPVAHVVVDVRQVGALAASGGASRDPVPPEHEAELVA